LGRIGIPYHGPHPPGIVHLVDRLAPPNHKGFNGFPEFLQSTLGIRLCHHRFQRIARGGLLCRLDGILEQSNHLNSTNRDVAWI